MNIENIYFEIEALHNKTVIELKEISNREFQIKELFNNRVRLANQDFENKKAALEQQIEEIKSLAKIAKIQLTNPIASQHNYKVDLMQLKRISVMIGPNKNDPMAAKLYEVATGQLNTLNIELRKHINSRNTISDVEVNKKLNEIFEQKNKIKQKFASTLKRNYAYFINNLIPQCDEIFRQSQGREGIDSLMLFDYRISIGDAQFTLSLCEELVPIYKEVFCEAYNENNNTLYIPCTIKLYDGQLIFFNAINKNFDSSLALPMTRRLINNVGHYMYDYIDKVIFIDPIRYNKSGLGVLDELCGGSESWIETVPHNSAEVENLLTKYINLMNEDNRKDNSTFTDGGLCNNLFIFYNYPEGYSTRSLELISQLIANIDAFKQTMLFIHDGDMSDETFKKIKRISDIAHSTVAVGDNFCQFKTNDRSNNIFVNMKNIYTFNDKELSPLLRKRFITDRQKLVEAKKITNDYLDVVGFRNDIPTKGNRKIPAIPVGIDEKGDLVHLSFETGTKFASFLCGSAGSGKSNLLHVIISGLIQNMHPDDIEIWLIDFKKTEFARYIDATPPHVRYVFLENTPELVYDLIDRLHEILEKRKNIFATRRYSDLWDVPVSTYMPSIFVIIDEFSEMSEIMVQSIENLGIDYTRRLQLILAEGRALGLHFIFSSQSFSVGTKGIREKQNIQQRLVMRNAEVSENRLTLDLHSASERDSLMIQQLKPHHLISKKPMDSDGNQLELSMVLNLSNDKEHGIIRSDYQRDYIERLNRTLHHTKNVKDYFDCNDQNGYVDKQFHFLDGNIYKSFIQMKNEINDDLKKEQLSLSSCVNLYIGEPLRMKRVVPIKIDDSFNENVLFVAPIRENVSMCSIISSISESLKMQGIGIVHWSDQNTQRFKLIKSIKSISGWTHVAEIDDLVSRIAQLKENIKNGIPSYDNNYYVISCISAIQRNQEYLDSNDSDNDNDLDETDVDINELDLSQQLSLVEKDKKKAEDVLVIVRKHSSKRKVYLDIVDSIKFILQRGPQLGYHFVVVLENTSELKQCKFEPEWFNHKLFYQMAKSDAYQILNSASASQAENVPEMCCRYTNGLTNCTFRPLLHYGIGWKNWYLNEDGIPCQMEEDNDILLM